MDGGQPLIFSGVGAACGNNEGQFLECDAGLECVYPENVAPGTLGTCEEPHDSGLGQECGDDITIQKKCADGLVCVFPPGGPFSEHTPGHCEVVAPQHRSEDLSFSRAHPGLLSRRSAVRALGEGCDDDSQCAADAFCDILAMPLDDTPQGVCTEIQCGFAHP